MRVTNQLAIAATACLLAGASCTSVPVATGRRAARVSQRNLTDARTALARNDGAAATDALVGAIHAAQYFERSRPSARLTGALDWALADVERDNLPAVVERGERIREQLVRYDVYTDTADTLQIVDEALAAAERGDAGMTRALLVRAKTAVRLRPIDRDVGVAHAALGAAYRHVALHRYRDAEADVTKAQAAFRRAENDILLAHALARVRWAEAAAPATDYREAGRQAGWAVAMLRGTRGDVEGASHRRMYELLGQLTAIDERARWQDATIWDELPEISAALHALLHGK